MRIDLQSLQRYLAPAEVIPIGGRRKAGLDQRSDDELMRLVRLGQAPAMKILVERYQERVRNYCRKWAGESGDDLAQDVFVGLWRARERYQGDGRFAVYLFTIVRNVCRNSRRRAARKPAGLDLASVATPTEPGPDQVDVLLERERQKRVEQAVQRLSPKLRETLLLRVAEGLSYGEISTISKISEATARARVHQAVKRLQDQLGGAQ